MKMLEHASAVLPRYRHSLTKAHTAAEARVFPALTALDYYRQNLLDWPVGGYGGKLILKNKANPTRFSTLHPAWRSSLWIFSCWDQLF